ncbi:MAG TPA: trigger factor [Burkholderiales bacterium]|nr:trigger factor [Burkholderiales bacterium]
MAVEVVSALERKVNFNVSKEVVNSQVAEQLKKYARQAKVQGFRPGKAPKHIVEQMYGGKAYEDALNEQLNKKFVDQLVEHKLNIVGYPKFDLTSSEGEEFIFAASFEVMPEVKLGDLASKEVERPICVLSDKDVETTIDILRKQRATHVVSEGAAAENGDKVTIDFLGKVDGVEFDGGKAEDYPFVLGQGWMLPDFETGVQGMKAGESKDVNVNFPESYHAENLKGKTAVFTITVKEVAKQELPELTPEFVKTLGVEDGTEASLRTEIKENLQREVDRRLKIKARDNALQALSEVSPLEVPGALVHDEIHNMMKNAEENMKKQGYKADQINLTHEMFEKDAKNMVTLRLLVQEFIKENSITASDDEVKKVVEDMASMYEDPTDYLAWYFQDEQRVNNAKAMAMEQKVTDSIYAKAQAKETAMSYEDIMKMQVQY